MTLLPMTTSKMFAHKLDSLQRWAWLPPTLLLLALSSAFIFGAERRGYFYREGGHNAMSAKNLLIAENLSPDHRFLTFIGQTLDAEGKTIYEPYSRFPIGSYALIKPAILPFGDDLSAKIYAAQMLMLLFFAAAAVLAYLSLRRLIFSRWIALTATMLAFSSAYCLYWNDAISSEAIVDVFGVLLVFHGMAVFEQEGRFRQLLLKVCLALLLGWHVYAMLLPFIAFGLMRELYKSRSGVSTSPHPALCQLKHATLSLMRSRYLTLGVAALLFGVSLLTFNFTNEYFALNRETPFTEIPSFKSMTYRVGVGSDFRDNFSWPAFMRLQFYRIGMMATPYIFSTPFEEGLDVIMPLLFVILGIATFIASLVGLMFVRRHKILLASLALSGFCWALPIRYNTAIWVHSHEALLYIGVTLTLFSLVLLCLRRWSGERLIAALSVAAALLFVLSALRMSQLDHPDKRVEELQKAVVADLEVMRSMTSKTQVIEINTPLKFHGWSKLSPLYFSGKIIVSARETAPSARTPDFMVTNVFVDGFAQLTPQNRKIFLYEWDDYHRHLDEVIEESEPLIRSDFDAHLIGNALMYVKDDCSEDDIREKFFLAVYPVDENDLPDWRRQSGFDNLDFHFEDRIIRRGERCVAMTPLPEYDIARIKTGHFIQLPDGSFQHLWEGEIHLTQ